jgi:hypothetical protein
LCNESYSDMYSVWIQWKLTTQSTSFTLSPFLFSFISCRRESLYNPILISYLRPSHISYPCPFSSNSPQYPSLPPSLPPSPTFGNRLSDAPCLLTRAQSPSCVSHIPGLGYGKPTLAQYESLVSAWQIQSALSRFNPRSSSHDS